MRHCNRQRGFTLIELLIVVTIIAIIAVIMIPNLLDAIQKAKQKRTIADLRNTGTAWMSWLSDQVGAASAGSAKTYDASQLEAVSYAELFGYLHPADTFFYMQEVPQHDGWSYTIAYAQAPSLSDANVLILGSGGRDGSLSAVTGVWAVHPFLTTDYDQDIVWADGYFVRWPDQVGD